MIVAGFGCRSGVSPKALLAVLHEAQLISNARITALAAPAFKRHETAFDNIARHLGLNLHWIEEAALVEVAPLCATQSDAALRATGHASVAEAAALAAAGPGAILVLPRIAHATATCALARKANGA